MPTLTRHRTPSGLLTDCYVDPNNGHDGNRGTYRSRWLTIDHALGAMAERMAWVHGDPTLTLLDDVRVTESVLIDNTTSGINGKTLKLRSVDETKGALSAGQVLSGWTFFSTGIYRRAYAGTAPMNVWVNGVAYSQSLRSASLGAGLVGTVNVTSTGFECASDSDVLGDPNPDQIRVGHWGTFERPWNRATGVVGNELRMIQLAHTRITDEPGYAYHFWDSEMGIDNSKPSYIWNLASTFFDSPTEGTFYYDVAAGFLYLCPVTGVDVTDPATLVIVPVLEEVLVFDGASDVTLEGLRVEHAHCAVADGFVERALGMGYFDSDHVPLVTGPLTVTSGTPGDYTNADQSVPVQQSLPSMVTVRDSDRINSDNYTRIQHGSGVGLRFEGICTDCEFHGSAVEDMGGNGIVIGDVSQATDAECSSNIRIRHSKIRNVGQEFYTGTGIVDIFQTDGLIEYVEVDGASYCGIAHAVGAAPNTSWWTKRTGNIARFNKVHDVMLRLSDGGGLYAHGTQGDTLLWYQNYVYNVGNAFAWPAGSPQTPMYFDQTTSNMLADENVVVARAGQPALICSGNADPNTNAVTDNYGNVSTVTNVSGPGPDVNTGWQTASNPLSISAALAIANAAGPAEPYRSAL